jgi:hypothetical protein
MSFSYHFRARRQEMAKVQIVNNQPAAWTRREDKSLTEEEQGYLDDAERLMRSPAYQDDSHPDHLQSKRDVRRLMAAVYGTKEEISAELERPISSEERFQGVK